MLFDNRIYLSTAANDAPQMGTEKMEKLVAKVRPLSTATLKDMAIKLFADMREGTDEAMSAVLRVLEDRLPENEFIEFVDGIA